MQVLVVSSQVIKASITYKRTVSKITEAEFFYTRAGLKLAAPQQPFEQDIPGDSEDYPLRPPGVRAITYSGS